MWTRLQTRAEQAARQTRPEQVFQKRASLTPAGRWPLLLAPAALLLWLLPPLTLPQPSVVQAAAVPVQQTQATGDPGSVQNSPFGSRESGSLVNEQLPDNPNALAAAPYDPGSKGSGVVKQKSSGPTGLRVASGGRGVESDGDDRCVQGCLTNNDMNRGTQTPTAAKPKSPGGSTRSGTSGGGGAAGNSSTVGLGTAQAREVSVTLRRQLLGGVTLDADRVRVLAAPDLPASSGPGGAAAQAGSWTRQPERLTPTDAVSAEARSAVQTYFRRTP